VAPPRRTLPKTNERIRRNGKERRRRGKKLDRERDEGRDRGSWRGRIGKEKKDNGRGKEGRGKEEEREKEVPGGDGAENALATLGGDEGEEIVVRVVEDGALEEDGAVHVVGKVLLERRHLGNLKENNKNKDI